MKKGLCSLVLLLLTSLSVFGQLRHEQQSQIGVRLGVNFTSIDDGMDQLEGIDEEPRMPRINAGLAASFWMNDIVAFAPELNYSQRGFQLEANNNASSPLTTGGTYTTRYNYVEVPLLLRATFGQQLVRGYVNLGPSVSYLLSGKEKEETALGTMETSIDTEDKKYNLFEVGAAAGGGVHFNTQAGSFMLDFRYYTGLTDIQKEEFTFGPYSFNDTPSKFRNQYFSIGLIFLGPYRK